MPITAALVAGCASFDAPPFATGSASASIIGGEPAPDRSAVVSVEHRDGRTRCGGTLIAQELVVTARHCLFRADASPDSRLSDAGFRVGFGPDDQRLDWRSVARVEWIAGPDASTVADGIHRGEDVGLLHLSEPAPPEARPARVQFDYVPAAADALTLVGYGFSSLGSGANGVRLEASVKAAAYQRATGIVQLSGPSACFGDSGGPLLVEPGGDLVGVITEVAGTTDASFCDTGTTYAATVANSNVRRFLEDACVAAGGCGVHAVKDGGSDASHNGPDDAEAGPGAVEGGTDAARSQMLDSGVRRPAQANDSGPGGLAETTAESNGCSCRVTTRPRSRGPWLMLGALMAVRRRCSRRGARQ